MSEVKLIGNWSSPYVSRAVIGLKLKGVEYEFIDEDLSNKSPLLLNYNPVYKKVPVLLHNGNPISESVIILEYIDEVWEGPSILPKDPCERAKARFWAKFFDDKCMLTMWKAYRGTEEERGKAKEEATEALKFLESEIRGKKFFGGDNIGLVDITASPVAYWFRIVEEVIGLNLLTEEKFPNLIKWGDEYCNNSVVKENLPNKDELVARYKAVLIERRLSLHL